MRLALLAVFALASAAPAATANFCGDGTATFPVNDGTVNVGEYAGSSAGLGNGFTGVLGQGATLSFDSDSNGNLAFALSATSATCTQGASDSIVIYLDSRTGGFTDTSTLTDNADQGRAAASGMGTDGARAQLNFASGFAPDYAIVIQNGFTGLFQLVAGGSHVFVKNLTRSSVVTVPPPCVSEWSGFTMGDLGAQLGTDIRYVATLLNSTNGFRSNEFHGVATAPGANIGIATHTFAAADFNIFRAGPGISYLNTNPVRLSFETYDGGGFQLNPTCGQLSSDQFAATGWSNGNLAFGGTQTTVNTDYTRGFSTVAVTTGGFYSIAVAPGNRVFGIQPGGSDFAPGTLTLRFQNLSSSTYDGADIAYTLWHRNDQDRSTSLNFAFSVDGINFVDLPALNFTTTAPLDALGWQQLPRTATLGGFELAPNQVLYLRFSSADVGGTGSRDELGLDDITVVPRTNVFAEFGDAPASYGSAGHMTSVVFMGVSADGEFAQQSSANAQLDDTNGNDDEDGVTFAGFYEGASTQVTVNSVGTARVSVWVDWNQDGAFGAGEQPVSNAAVVAGNNTLNVPVPLGVTRGATFMRVRIASANPTLATGPMADGEVEDYAISIGGCGDSIVNGTEQCDSGGVSGGECGCQLNCTWTPTTAQCGPALNGSCDAQDMCDGAGSCSAIVLTAGTECRAGNGVCDVAETCTGASRDCPSDGFASSGVCRNSAGPCDLAESCDGSGVACPADLLATSGVCRPGVDVCDVAESCNGSGAACPADGFASASTTCRGSTGTCDVAEQCTGFAAACPADGFAPSTVVCRSANGLCDVPETCTGSSDVCPADGFAAANTECRATNGVCDVAEVCSGSSGACPTDNFATSGVCRPSAGDCDVAESCNGGTANCPNDGFVATGTECRGSAGICDVAEACTGTSAACPNDGFASSATECRASAGPCDIGEACTGGSATCPVDQLRNSATVCRSANGLCDTQETCDGVTAACPNDAFLGSGTICRNSAGGCDVVETCSGTSGACPNDGFAPNTTQCRAANGICDVAENCSGTAATCPNDGFAPTTQECRAANGVCDVAETCSGSSGSCPSDGFAPSSTVCRMANGLCDVTESCSGTSGSCPNDGFAASGTQCRAANGVCDVAESCNGTSGACPNDGFAPTSTVCRPAAQACDAVENCTGTANTCPMDLASADGTTCNDTLTCNGTERCMSGACTAGTNLNCADSDACTMDMCAEPSGCTNMRIPGCCLVTMDCDDNDVCTDDACPGAGQMCTHVPVPGCVSDGGVDGGVDGGEADGGEVDGGGEDAGMDDAGMGTGGGGGATGGGGGTTGGGMATGGGATGGGATGGGATGGGSATGGGAGGGGDGQMPGCGCTTVDPSLVLGLALLALARRRFRRQ